MDLLVSNVMDRWLTGYIHVTLTHVQFTHISTFKDLDSTKSLEVITV